MHLLVELQLVVPKQNQGGGSKHIIEVEGCTYSIDVCLREGVLEFFSFQGTRDAAGCKTLIYPSRGVWKYTPPEGFDWKFEGVYSWKRQFSKFAKKEIPQGP